MGAGDAVRIPTAVSALSSPIGLRPTRGAPCTLERGASGGLQLPRTEHDKGERRVSNESGAEKKETMLERKNDFFLEAFKIVTHS